VESDQCRRGHGLDDAEAAGSERHGRKDVRNAVGHEEVDRRGDVPEGGDEGPERGGIEEPVRGGPQDRVLEEGAVRSERPQPDGEALDELLHLLFGDPRHPSGDGAQRQRGAAFAPREREHEDGEGGEQHGPDQGDGDIGAVEPVERDGDDECHPKHGVEDHGGTDSLGCERETGVGAVHPVRGEESVPEPRAAGGAAGDHVAHREGRQVDAEDLREARPVLGQHRPGEAPVGEQGAGLERETGE